MTGDEIAKGLRGGEGGIQIGFAIGGLAWVLAHSYRPCRPNFFATKFLGPV